MCVKMENVTSLLENLCHLQTHKQKTKETKEEKGQTKETKEVNEKENVAVKNSSVENLTR